MSEFVDVWIFGLLGATMRYATPLILAALGGLFSERSGVVNIALEGLMIAGAFFAILGADKFGHWMAGVLLAMVAGAAFAALHAWASIHLRADQIVSGTAIILLAAGVANFLNLSVYGADGARAESRPPTILPDGIPLLGDLGVLVGVTAVLLVVTSYVVFRTPFGLHLRAVGEHPRAADTVGIDVYRMRYTAVIISGLLAGLAGAYLSFDVGSYSEGMTGGKGFIALAALIFGKWNPYGAMAASLLFGFSTALGDRLQNVDQIPGWLSAPEILTALPYVITLIALAGFVGKSVAPAAVGKPYSKG